jgi:hypothetical protein
VLALANRPRRPGRARRFVALGVAAALVLPAGWLIHDVVSPSPNWPAGVVRLYDADGMRATVKTAAERWSESGAKVAFRLVDRKADADVIVRVDDRRLVTLCGHDCVGYCTSMGRPADGRGEVILRSNLTGTPRPLTVWVAAHELGHVLGLRHPSGRGCSVMAAHAFDGACAPSAGSSRPTDDELACVPAPADVDVAAGLYGGAAATRHPRCG